MHTPFSSPRGRGRIQSLGSPTTSSCCISSKKQDFRSARNAEEVVIGRAEYVRRFWCGEVRARCTRPESPSMCSSRVLQNPRGLDYKLVSLSRFMSVPGNRATRLHAFQLHGQPSPETRCMNPATKPFVVRHWPDLWWHSSCCGASRCPSRCRDRDVGPLGRVRRSSKKLSTTACRGTGQKGMKVLGEIYVGQPAGQVQPAQPSFVAAVANSPSSDDAMRQ